MIDRLTLIGVGLIGGSLARALKEKGHCRTVVGSGRNEANLIKAVQLGVIDEYNVDPAVAVKGADMIVVAVPLGAMRGVFEKIIPQLSETTVVTDVGSAKAGVVADLQDIVGAVPPWFVPGHPIAGTEKSGVEASFGTLFQQRRVILTPLLPGTAKQAYAKVEKMWRVTGAEVVAMSVAKHDRILSATSHLPHMLAFSLVNQLVDMRAEDDVFRFAAGGFRDFSRIASSDPVMWRDICLNNGDALVAALQTYGAQLTALIHCIQEKDSDKLQQFFLRSKAARDAFVNK